MTDPDRMALLRLDAISRRTPTRPMLDRVSLEVAAGECFALLGAPGSGRASLLRIVAGVEEPDAGRILWEGRDITRLPPRRRPFALVFRQDPLFGHASVFEAVAAAMPEAEDGAAPDAARVQHLLQLLGLAGDAGSLPAMLPGPKRRRLALARALAAAPRLLLVAEGFGPAEGRAAPRRWLREAQQRLGLAMILVAQGAEEALALADRVAVLEQGRVEQVATPAELRRRPASPAVARLLGAEAAVPAATAATLPPTLAGGPQVLEVVAPGLGVPARVLGATLMGATLRLDLELLGDGRQIEAEVPSPGLAGMAAGTIIGLRVRPEVLRGGGLPD